MTATTAGDLDATLTAATARLAAVGIHSARHDAEQLAAHALGVPRGRLRLAAFDPQTRQRFSDLVGRRAERVPLQHLLGSTGFRYIELAVGPGVFVPRPETETVVQWAVDALAAEPGLPDHPLLVDLCTGSGTIALCLAHEVPGAVVHAVERDPGAMEWTRRNAAARAAAGDPAVALHLGDVAGALHELDGRVDLVASNPPYVADGERGDVDPEVRDHDPGIALWAGPDGLDVVRTVAATAARLLRPGGLLVVEHSDRQGETAPALLRARGGWEDVRDHADLADRDRFVTARRSGTTTRA